MMQFEMLLVLGWRTEDDKKYDKKKPALMYEEPPPPKPTKTALVRTYYFHMQEVWHALFDRAEATNLLDSNNDSFANEAVSSSCTAFSAFFAVVVLLL